MSRHQSWICSNTPANYRYHTVFHPWLINSMLFHKFDLKLPKLEWVWEEKIIIEWPYFPWILPTWDGKVLKRTSFDIFLVLMQVFRLFDTKLKMPNKINYLVLLINKKKPKNNWILSNLQVYHQVKEIVLVSCSFKMMGLSCYVKSPRKIVITVIKHIKKFFS